MEQKRRDCSLTEDLLPLYLDDALSEESETFVREHLETCADCRARKEALSGGEAIPVPASAPPDEGRPLRRIRRKFTVKTAIIAGCSVLLCGLIAFFATFFGLRANALYPALYREIGISDADYAKTIMPAMTISSSAPGESVYVSNGDFTDGVPVTVRFAMPAGMAQHEENDNLFLGEGVGYIRIAVEAESQAAWYYPNHDFYGWLYERPTLSYVELCRRVLEYDLSAVSVVSSMRDIHIASAVREVRSFVSIVNSEGVTGEYYPVTGDLDGYIVTPQPGVWFICVEQDRTLVYLTVVTPEDAPEEGVGASAQNIAAFLGTLSIEV